MEINLKPKDLCQVCSQRLNYYHLEEDCHFRLCEDCKESKFDLPEDNIVIINGEKFKLNLIDEDFALATSLENRGKVRYLAIGKKNIN